MKRHILITASAMALSLVHTVTAAADIIELRADTWCPYNCDPASDRPGYMIELAQEALAQFGHDVRYQNMNWPRSIEYARAGRVNGIVGAVPEEAPDFVFGPALGQYRDVVAFRRGESVEINDKASFQGLRIGAINGYEYMGPVSEYVEQNRDNVNIVQFAAGDNALEMNLLKLQAGRLDMVAEVHDVLAYTISNLGLTDDIEISFTADSGDVFIAFSPVLESSTVYADQLAEGLENLRASGRYDEILATYGLSAVIK